MGKGRRRRKQPEDPLVLSKEHARIIVKRIALLGVDIMLLLEDYDIDHGAVEDDIMSLQGYINRLIRMMYAKRRERAKEILAKEEADKGHALTKKV